MADAVANVHAAQSGMPLRNEVCLENGRQPVPPQGEGVLLPSPSGPSPQVQPASPPAPVSDHFIGGCRRPAHGPIAATHTSPWDDHPLAAIASTSPAVVNEAVSAAATAFTEWGRRSVKERVEPLFRFKQRVEANLSELAALVSRESGKTPAEGEAGLRRGLEVVEYATSAPALLVGETLEVSTEVECSSRRYPLGVVAGITPFNFPAMVPLWMFPLALACGNTFVHKPSEHASLTPLRLAELLHDAGLPAGCFTVLQGDRSTVEALLDHPDIAAAAFVGSTPAARAVHLRGSAAGKRVLALGGAKNHLILLPDAPVAATARGIVSSAFGCAGQRCMAGSVVLAVGDCDALIEAIVEDAKRLRPGVDLGAIVSPHAFTRIQGYLDRAAKRGLTFRLDGRNVRAADFPSGRFLGPTILDHAAPGDECACEEIFGPVLTIVRVRDLPEALAIENRSPYGNAASLFTRDGAAAAHFEQHANAGMLGINVGVPVPREPFGFGGWNASRFGQGDITAKDALSFWTKTRKTTRRWDTSGARNWMS